MNQFSLRVMLMRAVVVAATGLWLGACSTIGTSSGKQVFDLGIPKNVSAPQPTSKQTIAIAPMSASEWLDSNSMVYRLAYVDAQQPKRYANSQWSGTPAELLTRSVRERFASELNVVVEGDTVGTPVLDVEIEEFDQVFDSAQQSRAVIKVRASILTTGRLIAQRSFYAERSADTPDAAGGAHALAALAGDMADQLLSWSRSYLK
jgi:cholesterol transport system auxiliary component